MAKALPQTTAPLSLLPPLETMAFELRACLLVSFSPIVQMSNLIRSCKAVTTAQTSPLPGSAGNCHCSSTDEPLVSWSRGPLSLYLFAAKKNTRGPCRQLKAEKVTRVTNSRINIVYDEQHQVAPTANQHSSLAHDIGHVVRTHCLMKWKSWKVMPDEMRTEVPRQLSTNYNLEDLDDESLAYINRLFPERYKQWKCDLHPHFQAFDDPHVTLQKGCPKELEGWDDSWAWLCVENYYTFLNNKKAKANKSNKDKKTLLQHSGVVEDSKFSEIDVFGDIFVRPGNELAESLHAMMMEKSQLVLQESASQLPPDTRLEYMDPPKDAGFHILTETLDQTLERRPGTYC
ncbi:unnamed protein product [Prunus armeniaca]